MVGFQRQDSAPRTGPVGHHGRECHPVDDQWQVRAFGAGLDYVATVGAQRGEVGTEQQYAVAPGESGEVSHIG